MSKQSELVDELWAVYYGNPLYDEYGQQIEGGEQQVLARALIAVLTSIDLPERAEIPK